MRWPSQRGLLSQLLASAALLAAWCVLWGSFALAVIAPPWMLPAAGARAAEVRPQGGSPGSLPGVAGPGERRS